MSEVQQSDHLNFLFSYMNNASPTGFEMEGQKIWTNYISPFVDEIRSDYYGTAYGIINPDHPYKVVVEAHADEISWFVNYINDEEALKNYFKLVYERLEERGIFIFDISSYYKIRYIIGNNTFYEEKIICIIFGIIVLTKNLRLWKWT